MKRFLTFLLIFTLFAYTPKVKGLDKESAPLKKETNIQNLYKENENEVIAVFNNKKAFYISSKDIYLMSQVVYGESRGEPYDGKVAVASVILNRLVSPKFPNSIEGVITQKNAFSCVKNGTLNIKPNRDSYNAVLDALKGYDPTSKVMFFYNPKIATCTWMKNVDKTNVKTIGNHVFFAAN